MKPIYDFGHRVRVTRTVRNDGTYPGLATGDKLVRSGAVGFVRDVGTFLQDQIIYTVHFVDEDRHIGCREQELIDADAPWVPTRFEFRSKVRVNAPLRSNGEVVADFGAVGEIIKVLRDAPGGPRYHVYFDGRTFEIPEPLLELVDVAAG